MLTAPALQVRNRGGGGIEWEEQPGRPRHRRGVCGRSVRRTAGAAVPVHTSFLSSLPPSRYQWSKPPLKALHSHLPSPPERRYQRSPPLCPPPLFRAC